MLLKVDLVAAVRPFGVVEKVVEAHLKQGGNGRIGGDVSADARLMPVAAYNPCDEPEPGFAGAARTVGSNGDRVSCTSSATADPGRLRKTRLTQPRSFYGASFVCLKITFNLPSRNSIP